MGRRVGGTTRNAERDRGESTVREGYNETVAIPFELRIAGRR